MRTAYNADVIEYDGEVIGVNLGADYCAEHEWGIKGIKRSFGIDEEKARSFFAKLFQKSDPVVGLPARSITKNPGVSMGSMTLDKKKAYFITSWGPSWYNDEDLKKGHKRMAKELRFDLGEKAVRTMWDEGDFFILSRDKSLIHKIYGAFENLDVSFFFSGGGVFENAGLNLVIASKVPEEVSDQMREVDLDSIALKKASEATGIHKILEKAGKGYYALSPQWKTNDKKEVIFWLNPREQQIYEACWCSVQDLKDWANDTGKIIKK